MEEKKYRLTRKQTIYIVEAIAVLCLVITFVVNNQSEQLPEEMTPGILPDGFTWHHNEQEGLMQLVDTVIHNQTNHTGGMSIWGRGY